MADINRILYLTNNVKVNLNFFTPRVHIRLPTRLTGPKRLPPFAIKEKGGIDKIVLSCPPSLLNFLNVLESREAGRYFLWPMRQFFVPLPALNFYHCRKL